MHSGTNPRRMKIWPADGKVNRWRNRWQASTSPYPYMRRWATAARKHGALLNRTAHSGNGVYRRSSCSARIFFRSERPTPRDERHWSPLWRRLKRRFRNSVDDGPPRRAFYCADESRPANGMERCAYSSRWNRSELACCSGVMSTRAMLTCGGRPAAHTMTSATSAAVSGWMPL